MILTLHGTGAGTPGPDRGASATTARFSDDSLLLLDAGEGCARTMLRDGVLLDRISNVVVSHTHPDHWCGLPGLLMAWAVSHRRGTVDLHLPEGTLDFFRTVQIQSMIFPEKIGFEPRYHELSPLDLPDGWHLTLFPTSHLDRVRDLSTRYGTCVQAVGYIFTNGSRKIVMSQDVGSESDLDGVIDGAEIVICESAHIDPSSILRLARDRGVGRVVFTHVPPGAVAFPETFSEIDWSVARDGERIVTES